METLLTAKDIANACKVAERTVSERWAKKEDFPKPIYLPAGKAGNSRKRWRESDIKEYLGLN